MHYISIKVTHKYLIGVDDSTKIGSISPIHQYILNPSLLKSASVENKALRTVLLIVRNAIMSLSLIGLTFFHTNSVQIRLTQIQIHMAIPKNIEKNRTNM